MCSVIAPLDGVDSLPGRITFRDTGASKQRHDELDCALSQYDVVLQLLWKRPSHVGVSACGRYSLP